MNRQSRSVITQARRSARHKAAFGGAPGRGRRRLVGLLGLGLLMASPSGVRAGPSAWKALGGKHRKASRAAVLKTLKRDGVAEPSRLLAHRYLVRLEFHGAGGGSANHSEVVVRFRSKPKLALAKAWGPGGKQPGRAQLGAWGSCKTRKGTVGRTCPVKYSGKGWVDVTSAFTGRNVLFVHDPARKGRGRSVVWFAADRSQQHLWYYVVPKGGGLSFGFGRLTARKYLLPEPQGPVTLPGNPPDPGGDRPGADPGARPPGDRATPPPDRRGGEPDLSPPRFSRRIRPARWESVKSLHRAMDKEAILRLMKRDGVAHPAYLLSQRFLVRIALRDAGGGSRSRTELQLRLLSTPTRALGNAWADRNEVNRAQIGAESRCRPLPRDQGGPEGRSCPVHFNGIGWRNLISAFTSVRMRVVSDPNDNQQGNVILWLAFDTSQSGLSHRFVERSSLPTFGRGKLDIQLFAVRERPAEPDDGPGPPVARRRPSDGSWQKVASRHEPRSREALGKRMRRDGLANPGYLLRHRYLVRVHVSNAGSAQGRRSELLLRTDSRPKAALGNAWSDHRRRWGAQLGAVSKCRRLPRPRNPYGSSSGWPDRPQGYVCPLQYNGLGWRNLISGFTETQVMLITAPRQAGRGHQLLWLAFDRPQPGLAYRPAKSGSDLRARVKVDMYLVGSAPEPGGPGAGPGEDAKGPLSGGPSGGDSPSGSPHDDSPADPGADPDAAGGAGQWKDLPGSHQALQKNALYWKIRRDGFKNPWYLLKKHYLVRIEVSVRRGRAETALRLDGHPSMAVGEGRAAGGNRSATQVGPIHKCRASDGRAAFCPLHFANIGWRNLASGLGAQELLVVTQPTGGEPARVVIWAAFDGPQKDLAYRPLPQSPAQAHVEVERYRW